MQARIAKTCDKTDGISTRIGRIFVETAGISDRTIVTFGKTTETFGPTGRICGKTRGRCGMIASNCGRMNALGPVPDSSHRTGNSCGTTVTIHKAIVEIYEPTARIDGISIGIGKTCESTGRIGELIGRRSLVAINSGPVVVARARSRFVHGSRRGMLGMAFRLVLF